MTISTLIPGSRFSGAQQCKQITRSSVASPTPTPWEMWGWGSDHLYLHFRSSEHWAPDYC